MSKKLLMTFLVVIAALFLRDHVIYQKLIIPNLSSVQKVPLSWWAGAATPVVIAWCVIGFRINSIKELMFHATIASLAEHIHEYISTVALGKYGFFKSASIESPIFFWTIGLIESFIFSGFFIGLAMVVRNLVKNERNTSNKAARPDR